MDAQAGMLLCCLQTTEDRFSHVKAHFRMILKYLILKKTELKKFKSK